MIPYDIDPSLHTGEPPPPLLDDGFSPPHADEAVELAHLPPLGAAEVALGEISPF